MQPGYVGLYFCRARQERYTFLLQVPCDVNFSVKPVVTKTTKFSDVFEVDHQRVQIPSHSHIYATVTFTPPSMQSFSAIFEAALEGVPQNQVGQRHINDIFVLPMDIKHFQTL